MESEKTSAHLRMTKQRQIILRELMKVTSHPTAYEVYDMVQKTMPQISLGTVYRNLELLSASGHIQRLSFGTGKRRYDGNSRLHYHLCCTECGKVDDLPTGLGIEERLHAELEGVCGYTISGLSMEAYGTCAACLAKQTGEK